MRQRLRFNTANELFDALPQVREDMRAKPTDQPSLDFLRGLAASETSEEAITFAAYLLPRREAVWWAHQCLSYVPDALTDLDHEMLALAEAWVREPEEKQRRLAMDAGTEADSHTPGVWVSLAAGWSGGSMAPAGSAPVSPPPFLTPRAVNIAILSLLARVETPYRDQTLRVFVESAIKLTES